MALHGTQSMLRMPLTLPLSIRCIPSSTLSVRYFSNTNYLYTQNPRTRHKRPSTVKKRHSHSQASNNNNNNDNDNDNSNKDLRRGDFVYKLAAGFVGKKNKLDPGKDHLRFDSEDGSYFIAGKPSTAQGAFDARLQSGQDACFVSSVAETRSVAFGVADGVGGWMDQGIDSADFAHGLCNYMAHIAQNYPKDMGEKMNKSQLHPLDLLQVGYNQVCADESIIGGGSTACIAVADMDGNMSVANLGDSGFVQLRLNAVHHFSNPQTHAFNTPFQLSRVPPKILAQIEAFGGGTPFSDMPGDASVTHHELRHGDILVFATDGVWDNMSPQDILAEVSSLMRDRGAWTESSTVGTKTHNNLLELTNGEDKKPGQVPLKQAQELQLALALAIARQAKAMSLNTKRDGPFAKAVHQAYPQENFHGGKVDDIAVVVAVAVDRKQVRSNPPECQGN